MKKILTVMSLLFVSLLMVGVVSAGGGGSGMYVSDVTLDGGSSVIVESGDDVDTEVTVTAWGMGQGNDWESTAYMIEGAGWTCVDTADHTYSPSGEYVESFTITVPALVAGSYDFSIRAYVDEDDCTGSNDDFTLDDGIIVVEEDSCSDCTLDIVNPLTGSFYSTVQGDILIDWTATGNDCGSSWDVFYGVWDDNDGCNLDSDTWGAGFLADPHVTEFFWDVSSIDEEKVCVKVEGDCCDDAMEGPLYIDNIDPVADANGLTCWCGDDFTCGEPQQLDCQDCCDPSPREEDVYTCYEGDPVTLDGSASEDPGQFPSGIVSYEWIVEGQGSVYSGSNPTFEYDCIDGDMSLDVELIVTDDVGNSGSNTSRIDVKNVAPVCEGIEAVTDVPLVDGSADVTFTGSASDVSQADEDNPLEFNWNFDDGAVLANGEVVTHTYTIPGVYTVVLSIEDKDGGVSEPTTECEHTVQVIDPVVLTPQEVAAFYPLVTDFGNDNGNAPNEFVHNVGSPDDCQKIMGPANLRVYDFGGQDTCTVKWDRSDIANPTNADRGDHFILVRIYDEDNASDVNYYSFNVMVHSWIIPLDEEWNLMSIPLTAEDSKPGMVFEGGTGTPIDQIWSYEYNSDTDTSEWMCVKPTSLTGTGSSCGTGITKLAEVKPGNAYWVKLKSGEESAVVKGMGISPNEVQGGPMLPPATDVPTNAWSLIGRYGIVGQDYNPSQDDDRRVHGQLGEDVALDSLTKVDNDMHVYDEDFTIRHFLTNNEGYWLWIEDNAYNNAGFESYAPIDTWYPENSGETVLN